MSDAWRPTGFSVGPEGAPDRYALGPAVGSGAEGILYRASLTTTSGLEFEVALKMLQPRFLSKVDEWEERWSEQVEVLRSLQVPGVVSVRDGFTGTLPHLTGDEGQGRTLYLVMNWVDGEPLDEWVRRNPDRDPLEDLRMLLPVAAALDLMHSGGPTGGVPVVHRDVKPANILVSAGSTVLVDFGLTRGLPEGQRLSGVTGTPGYLAPECQEDGLYTPASDRYAFGAVVFFVLTGTELPVRLDPAELEAVVRQAPILADRPELAARVLAMLDPDPEGRPPSLANWIGQLRQSSLPDLPAVLAPAARSRRAGEHAPSAASRSVPVPLPVRGSARRWAFAQLGTTRRRVAAAIVSVMVVATAVAFGAATGTQANTHSAVPYAFPAELFDGSLVADRTWTLSGTQGNHLLGTVKLTDAVNSPIHTSYAEVIPKPVARTLGALDLTPAPQRIVKVDPIVSYAVDLKPQQSMTISYTADIGRTAGPWLVRLANLANVQEAAEMAYLKSIGQQAPATLAQLTVSPSTLSLKTGQSDSLKVRGWMSDHSAAPPAALAGIAWASTEPAVATVTNGTVTAFNDGTTEITAQAGTLVSAATVFVTGNPAGKASAASLASPGYKLLRPAGSTTTAADGRPPSVGTATPQQAGHVPPSTTTTAPPTVGGPGPAASTTLPPATTTTTQAPPPPPPPSTTTTTTTQPVVLTYPPTTEPTTTVPPDTDPSTTAPPDTDPATTTTTAPTGTTTAVTVSGTPEVCATMDCGGLAGPFDFQTTVTNVTQVCVAITFSPGLASGWEVEVDINGYDLGGWYNNGGITNGVVQPASGPAAATTICSDPTAEAANEPLFDSLSSGSGMVTTIDNALVGGDTAIDSPPDTPFGVVSESITVTGTFGS